MKNVLLIDSGSGGINILKECVRICPCCNFLMFCDQKNLPYGSKSVEQLQEITLKNLRNIKKFFNFDIVILACNTLTCTTLQKCREEFENIIFIGTVPAIKPALEKFLPQEILVLATPATIKHNKTILKTQGLQLMPMENLASLIDENLSELWMLEEQLKEEFHSICAKAVVLGCTHYIAIQNVLQKVLGEDVEFFDSANGVARRLKFFVGDQPTDYKVQIVISGNEKMLPVFWQHFVGK